MKVDRKKFLLLFFAIVFFRIYQFLFQDYTSIPNLLELYDAVNSIGFACFLYPVLYSWLFISPIKLILYDNAVTRYSSKTNYCFRLAAISAVHALLFVLINDITAMLLMALLIGGTIGALAGYFVLTFVLKFVFYLFLSLLFILFYLWTKNEYISMLMVSLYNIWDFVIRYLPKEFSGIGWQRVICITDVGVFISSFVFFVLLFIAAFFLVSQTVAKMDFLQRVDKNGS